MKTPLREHIEATGITLPELAQKILKKTQRKVSTAMLSMIATGTRRGEPELLMAISETTGIPFERLSFPRGRARMGRNGKRAGASR